MAKSLDSAPEHRGSSVSDAPRASLDVMREKERITIIGGGINGLIAANYLARNGYKVTLLERNAQVGGACVEAEMVIDGKTYTYEEGASVFGFMQDFVFEETGLKERLQGKVYCPDGDHALVFSHRPDVGTIFDSHDARTKLKERGRMRGYEHDSERVTKFLRKGFREAIVPTFADARRELGPDLTKRWLEGSAAELVRHYFRTPEMQVAAIYPLIESGPQSMHDPESAFTIPLMHSGSIFDGKWGYVRGGIQNMIRALQELNTEAGVQTITSAAVKYVDPKTGEVSYEKEGQTYTQNSGRVIFATEPVSASEIISDKALQDSIETKDLLGNAGKASLIFRKPVVWIDKPEEDAVFRYHMQNTSLDDLEQSAQSIRNGQRDYAEGSMQIYPVRAGDRHMGVVPGTDLLSVYTTHVGFGKKGSEVPHIRDAIARNVLSKIRNPEDYLGGEFKTPLDLKHRFGFRQGNIDHIAIARDQVGFARTYSPHPERNFFQFGDHSKVYYCGAGTYPCGSIAGTAGYMCAVEIMRERDKKHR